MLQPLTLSFDHTVDQCDRADILFQLGSGDQRRVSFRSDGVPLRRSGNVLLCLGLIPAMELGVDLIIEDPVESELLDNSRAIQDLLVKWYPGYRSISVQASTESVSYPDNRGAGLFFSGGVDSAYSLADTRQRLQGLVTIVGADFRPDQTALADRVRRATTQIAEAYRLSPIVIETDARDVTDRLIGWVEYHGAFLAAVRHLLADRFGNMLIASSADSSSWSRRWGSHPGLDPLFGTTGAAVEHHGLVDRLGKIERILDEPLLMTHLRVCYRSQSNCCVCEKCAFVMQALDLLDGFDRAPTFSRKYLDLGKIVVTGEGSKSDLQSMRARALELGSASALVGAIDRAMWIYERNKSVGRWLPWREMSRRFKRLKRQRRYASAARSKLV